MLSQSGGSGDRGPALSGIAALPSGGAQPNREGMAGNRTDRGSRPPTPRCPIRPGEACTLCQIDVTGPQDCGLVYLVMHDPELREGLRVKSRAASSDAPTDPSPGR